MAFYKIVRRIFDSWIDDDAPTYAAAISLYAMISLAPLITILVKVGSLFFKEELAQRRLFHEVQVLAGFEAAQLLESIVENSTLESSGWMATLISVGVLLFGATGVFAQLHTALNRIWGLPKPETSGVKNFFKVRLRSLLLIFGVGGLLMLSIVLSTVASVIAPFLAQWAGTTFLWQLANFGLSFVVMTFLFAMIYKYLPDTNIDWRDTFYGAMVTSALFGVGKLLIGIYLSQAAPGSAYGASGSLVAFLIWVFYSAQVVLIGAEFTQVNAERRGEAIGRRE